MGEKFTPYNDSEELCILLKPRLIYLPFMPIIFKIKYTLTVETANLKYKLLLRRYLYNVTKLRVQVNLLPV